MLQAACSCGYTSGSLMYGIGFAYFETGSYWELAYCDQCSVVKTVDGKKKKVCGKCKNQLQVYKKKGASIDEDSMPHLPACDEFEDGQSYHCPRCKEEKLIFQSCGCWD